jgi:hypothetical protein
MPLKDLVILHPLKKTIPSGQSKDCLLIFDRPTGKCGDVDFRRYQMIRAQSIRDGTKIPLAGRPKTAGREGPISRSDEVNFGKHATKPIFPATRPPSPRCEVMPNTDPLEADHRLHSKIRYGRSRNPRLNGFTLPDGSVASGRPRRRLGARFVSHCPTRGGVRYAGLHRRGRDLRRRPGNYPH